MLISQNNFRMIDFDSFNLLLNAKSKDFVKKICHESMNESHSSPKETLGVIAKKLDCTESETETLLSSLRGFISKIVQGNIASPEEINSFFPEDFHKNLASLLTKIIVELLPLWRQEIAENEVSLPKLASFSWSVSAQQDSNTPLCFLNLNIKEKSGTQSVNAHLSKESLASLLSGLKQIKTQINQLTS